MKPMKSSVTTYALGAALAGAVALASNAVLAAPPGASCPVTHAALTTALVSVVDVGGTDNAGLGNNMWATVVNRDGVVCNVTFSGSLRGDQWPLSRVISAQKANTANGLSLETGAGGTEIALSTANLWAATQPGGSLWELTQSNPVDTEHAYAGSPNKYGTPSDPMKGKKVGGVNVFGGGLALYDGTTDLVGAVGVSGDFSCTDHVIAWKVRDALDLDDVPGGVSPTTDDNIIFDLITVTDHVEAGPVTEHPATVSTSGFGHPDCGGGVADIAGDLPDCFPIGAVVGPVDDAAPSCPAP